MKKALWLTYVLQECGKWYSAVSCKRPELARCSCYFRDSAGRESDDKYGDHDICCSIALRGIIENLDERKERVRFQNAGGITHCKTQGQDHDETEDCVKNYRPRHGSGQRL